jgi:hypothetical protein
VDGDAPMVEQHRFAPFLVKRLEERGAVVFEGLWTITDVGESALAELVENEARGAR